MGVKPRCTPARTAASFSLRYSSLKDGEQLQAVLSERGEMNVTRLMLFIIAATPALSTPARAQLDNLDKGPRVLIERGSQIHGRNLGSVLVLKGVLYIPGQHMDAAGNIVNNPAPAGIPNYPSGFYTTVKDPWIRGVHSIANPGSKNNGLGLVPGGRRIRRRSQLQ
jgi:hypothetical protein